MTSPSTLIPVLGPVAGDNLPVQDHVGEALVVGPLQRLRQVRGLLRQHDDYLIEIAVGGGPRDAMVVGQYIGGGAVMESPQAQQCLPKAGQRPAAARGAAPAPLREQRFRNQPDQFPGASDVAR